MNPSIGRIVHFVPGFHEHDTGVVPPGGHYAAIITHVHSASCVNLQVFPKGGPMDSVDAGVKTSVVFESTAHDRYTWHWPEREE